MADVPLPTNAISKRNVAGTTVAALDLTKVTTGANQSVAVCELPVGVLVTDIVVQNAENMGNIQLGIEGDNVTDDPDFFLAAVASGANNTIRGNLRLPYEVLTEGERVTLTSVTAITVPATGVCAATYSQDGFVA